MPRLFPLKKIMEYFIIKNENLPSVRGALLPKLMNGEIEVDSVQI